jgi:endonuclease YncB( thermonuclease family)
MTNSKPKTTLAILVVLFLSGLPFQSILPENSQFYTVKRVIDGDTIELDTGEIVRYMGVDTPETDDPLKPVQYYGKEAKEYNAKLVQGKKVKLEIGGKDQRGRILAYVYLEGGTLVDAQLLKHGYAKVYDSSKNTEYAQIFRELEQLAKEAGIGLWPVEGRLNWLDEQTQAMHLEIARMQSQMDHLMQRISVLEGGESISIQPSSQAQETQAESVHLTPGPQHHRNESPAN